MGQTTRGKEKQMKLLAMFFIPIVLIVLGLIFMTLGKGKEIKDQTDEISPTP